MSGAITGEHLLSAEGDGSVLERLKSSSDRLAALDDERRAELGRRNALIVQARDQSTPWSRIARAARVSMARCVTIVGGG